MKKLFFSITLAAVVGTVSYFSMPDKADDIVLNPMELANIEALGFDEVEPAITCNYPSQGLCWRKDVYIGYCTDIYTFNTCSFSGSQQDYCVEPCIHF